MWRDAETEPLWHLKSHSKRLCKERKEEKALEVEEEQAAVVAVVGACATLVLQPAAGTS